jgi:Uncharacterized conserved protein
MGNGYRFIEHTADVEFIATGKDMPEAIKNAAMAMFETICDVKKVSHAKSRMYTVKIKKRTNNYTDLAWSVLQYLLSVSSSKGLFLYTVDCVRLSEKGHMVSCAISAFGKPESEEFARTEVKAVSRYEISAEKTKNGYRIRAVLDV